MTDKEYEQQRTQDYDSATPKPCPLEHVDVTFMRKLRKDLLDTAESLNPDNIEACRYALKSIAMGLIPLADLPWMTEK